VRRRDFREEDISVVSNTFAKSIGLSGSKAIKGKSITEGGGCHYKPDHSGDQDDAKVSMPNQRRGFQEKAVNSGSGAKGQGGNVDKPSTTRDPLQRGGSKYAK
jgi:hypothetical protein